MLTCLLATCLKPILAQVLPNIPIPPPPEYSNTDSICEVYTQLAKQDFENGAFNWVSTGLHLGYLEPENFDSKFNQFFDNYLTSKYDLRIINSGCIAFNHSECYSNTLDSLILEKFGESYFEEALKSANNCYQKWKTSKIPTEEIFDWSKVYYTVDSPVKLNGNDQALAPYPKRYNAHSIELVVDTTGRVTAASILKTNPLKRVTSKDLVEELNTTFEWVPAYLYQKKVNSTYLIK